jgi:nicotinate-nucleotide pyrophosphorylase (carboxylating)
MNRLTNLLIEMALMEDFNEIGDLTSETFVDARHRSAGWIIAREELVVSGQDVASRVCASVDPLLHYQIELPDGSVAKVGQTVGILVGATQSVLKAERTVLNFLQRLCGVATTTRSFVQLVSHTTAVLLDTRKTTPGLRHLEKAAVRHGGGRNHRFGLYDAVMLKDNHLAADLVPAEIERRIKALLKERPDIKIEIEADRLDQVEALLPLYGVSVILLDNMTLADMRRAIVLRDTIAPHVELEASGGVRRETISAIAETGVDYISVGALTHSVRSVDLGLDLLPLDDE